MSDLRTDIPNMGALKFHNHLSWYCYWSLFLSLFCCQNIAHMLQAPTPLLGCWPGPRPMMTWHCRCSGVCCLPGSTLARCILLPSLTQCMLVQRMEPCASEACRNKRSINNGQDCQVLHSFLAHAMCFLIAMVAPSDCPFSPLDSVRIMPLFSYDDLFRCQ